LVARAAGADLAAPEVDLPARVGSPDHRSGPPTGASKGLQGRASGSSMTVVVEARVSL